MQGIEAEFDLLAKFVNTTRTSRALLNCPPSQPLAFLGTTKDSKEFETLTQVHSYLENLARGTIQLTKEDNWAGSRILRLVVGSIIVGTQIDGDIDLQHAIARVKKQTQEKGKEFTRLQKRLSSSDFAAKADPEVVQESKDRLNALTEELHLLASSEAQLHSMLG